MNRNNSFNFLFRSNQLFFRLMCCRESDGEESDDDCDYTVATIAQLPVSAREVIDTIKSCKALVRFIKKVI